MPRVFTGTYMHSVCYMVSANCAPVEGISTFRPWEAKTGMEI
jgi:hypothetical protein